MPPRLSSHIKLRLSSASAPPRPLGATRSATVPLAPPQPATDVPKSLHQRIDQVRSGLHPNRVNNPIREFTFAISPLIQNHTFHKHQVSQTRWASHAAPAKSTETIGKISIGPQTGNAGEKETGVVYYGPISSTIKKVKLLSLSTCCLSVSLGPVITFLTSPDMNVILKGAVASTVILLSASTTAALHWFVSPYIHKLRWQPGSDSFEVEMMSWLATYVPRTIRFIDIQPAETKRPFVTFKANGNFYFVDVDHCSNKALLQKLTPQPLQSAFKNI